MSPLGLAHVSELPDGQRSCLLWELGEASAREAVRHGDPGFEKEAWLSHLLLTWGHAGRVAHVDDQLVGAVVVAPPVYSPRADAFPTSPISGDAVLLMSAWVDPAHRGTGIARMLVQGVAKDLTQRGVRAIEAFALSPAAEAEAGGPSDGAPADPAPAPADGSAGGPGAGSTDCVVPRRFYDAVGFTEVRAHHRFPRVRLELRSALAWREDVEVALDQLLGTMALAR